MPFPECFAAPQPTTVRPWGRMLDPDAPGSAFAGARQPNHLPGVCRLAGSARPQVGRDGALLGGQDTVPPVASSHQGAEALRGSFARATPLRSDLGRALDPPEVALAGARRPPALPERRVEGWRGSARPQRPRSTGRVAVPLRANTRQPCRSREVTRRGGSVPV